MENPPPDSNKRSRPDRVKKKEDAKNLEQTVVKCSLNTLLLGNKEAKETIKKLIDDRVSVFSRRMVLCSLNLNKMIREFFHEKEDVTSVQLPIFTSTMIRHLMLGLKGCHVVDSSISDFFNRNPELHEKVSLLPRHDYDRNIYSFGATKYLTNYNTFLARNLSSWIKKWIYSKMMKECVTIICKQNKSLDSKMLFRYLLYDLHSWKLDKDMKALKALFPEWVCDQIAIQKQILGNTNITDRWLKLEKSKSKIISYNIWINRFLKSQDAKLVPTSPICTIKSHFITIDTSVVFGIMKSAELVNNEMNFDDFAGLGKEQWGTILKFEKVQGNGRSFTSTVDTDGVSINVHFTKPKAKINVEDSEINEGNEEINVENEENETKVEEDEADKNEDDSKEKETKEPVYDPNDNVWACDPGRTSIFYMVRRNQDGTKDTAKLSRNQYYNESGIFKAKKETEKWMKEIKTEMVELSNETSKGDSLETFNGYMSVILKHWDALWSAKTNKKWANQRLRLYGGKKRCFAKFFNRLESSDKTKKTVIAYGSAKFAPGGKGEISVPVSRAYKECKYRFETVLVSEFRTTVMYNGDKKTQLKSVISKKTGNKIRGLLWFSTNNEGKFIDRDLNAAENILDCFILPTRPEMLCPPKKKKALPPMKIGKVIRK